VFGCSHDVAHTQRIQICARRLTALFFSSRTGVYISIANCKQLYAKIAADKEGVQVVSQK
jgi:hypothetical protein